MLPCSPAVVIVYHKHRRKSRAFSKSDSLCNIIVLFQQKRRAKPVDNCARYVIREYYPPYKFGEICKNKITLDKLLESVYNVYRSKAPQKRYQPERR